MDNLKNKLHLTDYYLIDFDMSDMIKFVRNNTLKREDVESVIDEYKSIGINTRREIERCEILAHEQYVLLENLRQAYLDGKIKTEQLTNDSRNIVPKTKSFKSAIKRVSKRNDINLEFLKCSDDGQYYIDSFHSQEYKLNLSHIVSDESYQDLLKRNHEHYSLNLLYIYIAAQAHHHKYSERYHNMYKEISEFLWNLGFTKRKHQ